MPADERERDRETERLRDRETDRQRDRQRDRQTDRDRDRQTDRQTDRQRVCTFVVDSLTDWKPVEHRHNISGEEPF